ncbi:MAG TPA: SMC-Scp complex subunit ScpB [Acidiferrobacterales bacterium]|nr:SMC-Scp complex subunit ScpB [Acidiferrobacterales bacterium]
MTHSVLKNIIEAALLVAGQPLSIDKMLSLFPEGSRPLRDELQAVLCSLQEEYADRGIELKQIDHSYRFQTREKYSEWIARLSEERPLRYSRALLETLAIIAYRQPVTRGEIEEIRGVTVSSEIIKTLLGREWIRQVGQREVPGRPALYGTTRGFLEHFNLHSLDELPKLSELRDIDKIAAELNLQSRMEPAGAEDEQEADAASSDEIKTQSEKPAADGANGAANPQSSDTANSLR